MLIKNLSLKSIVAKKNHREFPANGDEMASLMGSLKENGLQSPIRVIKEGKKFRIIFGHRRYHAALKLKMAEIPAIIETRKLSEDDILIQNLLENIQRKNPSPIELGLAFNGMIKKGYTINEIGLCVGRASSFIKSCIHSAKEIPVKVREKIVIRATPQKRKKDTISLSTAKVIEGVRKSGLINRAESNVLYKAASKGNSSQKIKDIVTSVRRGADFKEAIKTKGQNKIINVNFSLPFYETDIKPDLATFRETLKTRIYKEFKFKKP